MLCLKNKYIYLNKIKVISDLNFPSTFPSTPSTLRALETGFHCLTNLNVWPQAKQLLLQLILLHTVKPNLHKNRKLKYDRNITSCLKITRPQI